MCWRRMVSGRVIDRYCGLEHLVAEVRAQVLVGAQLDVLSPKEAPEFQFHRCETDQSGNSTRIDRSRIYGTGTRAPPWGSGRRVAHLRGLEPALPRRGARGRNIDL